MSESDQYRILIPSELEVLINAIPQERHEILIRLMFNTGARYEELTAFAEHLSWFDARNRAITIPEGYTKTKEKRTIHLTPQFTRDLEKYLKRNKILEFPRRDRMNRNLKNWWQSIPLPEPTLYPTPDDWYPTVKTFRKTWESYLLATGHDYLAVCCNMGHSPQISYNHYANLDPRLKSCMNEVQKLVEGWMT